MEPFFCLFFLVFGLVFLFAIAKGLSEWAHNNSLPILTKESEVISKRTHVQWSRNTGSRTAYYVTFELEGGERLEFEIPAKEYGMLREYDRGELTFQGTRYHGFTRHRPGSQGGPDSGQG
ncbi:MAG: DUF2500 domain-containing protein [Planctomycetaceae bacterium]